MSRRIRPSDKKTPQYWHLYRASRIFIFSIPYQSPSHSCDHKAVYMCTHMHPPSSTPMHHCIDAATYFASLWIHAIALLVLEISFVLKTHIPRHYYRLRSMEPSSASLDIFLPMLYIHFAIPPPNVCIYCMCTSVVHAESRCGSELSNGWDHPRNLHTAINNMWAAQKSASRGSYSSNWHCLSCQLITSEVLNWHAHSRACAGCSCIVETSSPDGRIPFPMSLSTGRQSHSLLPVIPSFISPLMLFLQQ